MTENSNTNKKILSKLQKREKRFPWIAIISLVIALTMVSIIVDYFFGESDYLGNIMFISLFVTYFIWVIITFLYSMGLEESVYSYLMEHDIDWPSTPDIITALLVFLMFPSFLFFSIIVFPIVILSILFCGVDTEINSILFELIYNVVIPICLLCLFIYIDTNLKKIIKRIKNFYVHPIILLIFVILLSILSIYIYHQW